MKKLAKVAIATLLAASTVCAFASCDNRIAIGVQSGTTGQYFVDGDEDWGFDGLAGYKSKGYTSGGLAVSDLKNGNVQYVVIDQMPAKELDKAIDGIKVIDIPLTEEEEGQKVETITAAFYDGTSKKLDCKVLVEDGVKIIIEKVDE